MPRGDTLNMRTLDLQSLQQRYPEGTNPTEFDALKALGIELPGWATLEEQIYNDLVETVPYGIGWWTPEPGTKRRILISDQLYACAISVTQNMTESALHWLEFQDASERDRNSYLDSVRIANGRLTDADRRPADPHEQLIPAIAGIHRVGLVRALASALDCLAGVIIGVAALPVNILRADFQRTRRALADPSLTQTQKDFASNLDGKIVAAGPTGWLDWTLDYRNMVVHRGRRLELGQRIPGRVYKPDGVPSARRVTQIPRDPARSEVQVFLDSPQALSLTEEEEATLSGLLDSTTSLLEATARDLFKLWRWRKQNPTALPQRKEQWEEPSKAATAFNGYAPGTHPLDASAAMVLHPTLKRRFGAASLLDPDRANWKTFD